MRNFPLGVSTWNFNSLAHPNVISLADNGRLFSTADTEMITDYYRQIADTVLASEISAVELWYNDAISIEPVMEQLRRLSDAGKIRSVHAPFGININPASADKTVRRSAVEVYIKAADILNELDGDVLTVHGSAQPVLPEDLESCIKYSADCLAETADHCDRYGLLVAVEILVRPNLGYTYEELRYMCSLAGKENIGFCIDVNHVFPAERLIETVKNLGDRLYTLHISDYDGIIELHQMPFAGIIDWGGFCIALESVGYDGPFLYEARFPAESISGAIRSISENYAKIKQL